MFRFYTPENVWKLLAFSRFPGNRNETLAWNELTEWTPVKIYFIPI